MSSTQLRQLSSEPMTLPAESGAVVDCSAARFVNLGTQFPVAVNGSQPFTVELWVRFNTLVDGQILSQVTNQMGALNLGVLGGDRFYAHLGSGQMNIQGLPGLEAGQWYHVGLAYDGNMLWLYRDGALEAQNSGWGSSDVGSAPVLLASIDTQGAGGVDADIWDLAVFSSARTAQEVLTDMWVEPDQTVLSAYYNFSAIPAVETIKNLPFSLRNGAVSTLTIPALCLAGNACCIPSDEDDINPVGTDPYTIQAWVYLEGVISDEATVYWTGAPNATGVGLAISSQCFVLAYRGSDLIATSSVALQTDQWHNIACTFDGALVSVYVDGQFERSGRAPAIPSQPQPEVLIGASDATGTRAGFFPGYIQFVQCWTTALPAQDVATYMYTDPLYQDGLVADFGFTLEPANDLMEGHDVVLQEGAVIQEMRIPVPNASQSTGVVDGRVVPDTFAHTPLTAIDLAPLREALGGVAPPSAEKPFGFAHEQLLRREFQNALPAALGSELRAVYARHFEEQLGLAKRVAAGERVPTPWGHVVHEVVDGQHVVTHHTEDGSFVVLRADEADVDPCVVWWVTFSYTMLVGLLGVFGFPTPAGKAQEFATKICQNQAFIQTVKSLIGGTFTALTILSFLRILYDFGLLKTFIWFCISNASWWALARFVIYLIGLFAPAATPQKALFIANAVVLVAQLVLQVGTYPCGGSLGDEQ